MVQFTQKERYTQADLAEIMRILRAPGGCPWDAEQTHESIKKNLIEETYEVIEAINRRDDVLLCEELGDVLMQVVFHAQMAQEAGAFALEDVADGVCRKLVERHPHVFGDVTVADAGEVLSNWDKIKRSKKGQAAGSAPMLGVPRELPALMRSGKVQQKAAAVGFDWPDADGAMDKLREELGELQEAMAAGDSAAAQEELGDLLFSAVNVSRFLHCDAEEALTSVCDKFIARFIQVEKLAKQAGIDMQNAALAQMDELWDEAKLSR